MRPRALVGLVLLVFGACAGAAGQRDRTRPETPAVAFTVAASGDILVHAAVAERAIVADGGAGEVVHDFGPLLAGVVPVVSGADMAICHLETPLASAGAPLRYGPRFSVPASLAPAVAAAGYDACTTASNHALDAGEVGVRSTLAALDGAGLAHAGTARDEAEARRPVVVQAGPARVGLLAYTFGFNDAAPARDRPWLAATIDEARILADARAVRAAGADFVVVSLHWGIEFDPEPQRAQRDLARRLLGSPAVDLLLGHHPHVVQPIERIGDKYAVYSLGNLLSGQPDRCCPSPRDGVIVVAEVALAAGAYRTLRVTSVPTSVDPATSRVRLR